MITSEMLQLSLKLENFDEALFKEYITYPIENNSNLVKDKSNQRRDTAKKNYATWHPWIFKNVLPLTDARIKKW